MFLPIVQRPQVCFSPSRFIDSTAALKCGQRRLKNVERTHLVLASSKLVLQKNTTKATNFNRSGVADFLVLVILSCDLVAGESRASVESVDEQPLGGGRSRVRVLPHQKEVPEKILSC